MVLSPVNSVWQSCSYYVHAVKVSPKQLLGEAELQHHACHPVKDCGGGHTGTSEWLENRWLHRDSRPVERTPKPHFVTPSHNHRPANTHPHYDYHLPNNQWRHDENFERRQLEYHRSAVRQSDMQRSHGFAPQVRDALTKDAGHGQRFNDTVSSGFELYYFHLFCFVLTLCEFGGGAWKPVYGRLWLRMALWLQNQSL